MAFRQQHRPQSSRHISYHEPPAAIGTASPHQKKALEESEEWVLFSPGAPSTTARTHTTSTERTPRTAGLSRLSDFGSLDTAARSQDDEHYQGTEEGEELDSLDDGLHAFHEPSEYAGPTSRLQQSGDTVLPTHDGLGTFQPDADVAEHMWQFERPMPRRRHARRRSSVQQRLDALEETEELNQEQDRRQRIEQWRLEQSRALLEEIERETRRRRRMSMVSAARSRADSAHQAAPTAPHAPREASASDGHSETSDESGENLSFWQRLTRRVIRDLMGIDEDTLSVIFGESLPESHTPPASPPPEARPSIDATLAAIHAEGFPDDAWQHRLLERVARELGLLVHQLSEHPGAFSSYRSPQDGPSATIPLPLPPRRPSTSLASETPESDTLASSALPSSAHFAPTFPGQPADASLWGIEEEPEPEAVDPLDAFRQRNDRDGAGADSAPKSLAEELRREQAYWERELDVKMVFTFLLRRFSSRRESFSQQAGEGHAGSRGGGAGGGGGGAGAGGGYGRIPNANAPSEESDSARRAALIRLNHPLVSSRSAPAPAPAPSRRRDSPSTSNPNSNPNPNANALPTASARPNNTTFKTYYTPPHPLPLPLPPHTAQQQQATPRSQASGVRSSSSVTSQSKRSRSRKGSTGGRNYWDFGGSVGSGSVIEGKA